MKPHHKFNVGDKVYVRKKRSWIVADGEQGYYMRGEVCEVLPALNSCYKVMLYENQYRYGFVGNYRRDELLTLVEATTERLTGKVSA